MDTIYELENRGFELLYHWIFLILSGLRLIERADEKVNVYLPWLKEHGFHYDSIEYFKDKFNFLVELPNMHGKHIVKHHGEPLIEIDRIAKAGLLYLRNKILPKVEYTVIPGKYVYLTRKQSDKLATNVGRGLHHSILNEEALVCVLSSLGFDCIALETLDFNNKIKLFRESEIIVSPFGGGLSLVALCESNQTVVELKTKKQSLNHYKKMCDDLSVPFHSFSEINHTDSNNNIDLKLDELFDLLKSIINK